jgi:hypothetical protein
VKAIAARFGELRGFSLIRRPLAVQLLSVF